MGCGTSKAVDPHALAAQGSVAGLAQWIDAGGHVDAVDSLQGRGSLLQVAARHDKVECLNLLLKCGADVDLTTPEHGTALHAAASAGASSIVPLLLDVGASTTIRFQGQTAADMAQQAGYPATASLIRMSHAHPPEHTSSGTSLGRNSSSFQRQQQQQQQLRLTQSQRERAAAQQQAAQQQETARRLREIHKQLVAAEAESRVGTTAGHAASPLTSRRASADPTGGGGNSTAPLPASSLGHADNSAPQWQHVQRPSSPPLLSDTASLSNSLRLPSRQPSAAMQAALVNRQMPSDAELQDMLDRAQRQGAYRAGSNNASERSGRVAGRSSSSRLRQVSPPSPLAVAAQPDAADADDVAAGAAEGVAAGAAGAAEGVAGALPSALPAVGAASGPVLAGSQLPFTDPRRLTSLPRIDSSEIAEGIYGDGGGAAGPGSDSDSHDSSDEKSLADDPLMHFVRMAMTSKQPAALSSASPFAAAAQMCEPAASQTSEQQQQQQQHQQQQQQQQGSDTAQHTGNGVQSPAGPALPSAQLPTTPSVRLPVARSASLGSGSIALTPTAQRFRGGGSISLAVDIRPWEIQFEDLALQKTIGEGSFGKVYVAKWHETMVAVKVLLDLEEAQQAAGPEAAWTLSNPILCNLQKECGLMASLRHPNVVQFMGVSAMPPAMITEYCAKGSMADVLKAACKSPLKAAPLTWLRRLNMALDATKGMLYLHKRGIVHRDLKSPNLLVESTWKVKVADFNLSKIVEDTHSGSRSTAANMNPRWLAPEILNGEPATTASDVFSWGVVMWELLTFQVPWPHVSPWGLVGKLMDGLRLQVPPKEELPGPDNQHFVSFNEYVALMQRCWAQDPALRPCFEEVIVELRKMLEVQARSLER